MPRRLLNIVIVAVTLLWVLYSVRVEPVPSPSVGGGLIPDFVIRAPEWAVGYATQILNNGRLEVGSVVLDVGRVQTISVSGGEMRFSPPARVMYDGPGVLNVGTTVTSIRVGTKGNSVLIDIDRSPVDVEILAGGTVDDRE